MSFNNITKRVIHFVRHARSEFNDYSKGQIEGYFAGMTILDAKLTDVGRKQCEILKYNIENDNNATNNPLHIKNAQLVIASPLSRALHTAQLSMPMSKYKYMIRAEVTEQIENTSDIGYLKSDLLKMYPELLNTIGFHQLPEIWWWRHPMRWNTNINNNSINNSINNSNFDEIHPNLDANLLHHYSGKLPAAESKYQVRKRCQMFLKWYYSENNSIEIAQNSENSEKNAKNIRNSEFLAPINLNNIAVFSHSCTIKEFELLLQTIENNKELSKEYEDKFEFRKNTEVVSYQLPKNSNEIDWELLEYVVNRAKGQLNHADTREQTEQPPQDMRDIKPVPFDPNNVENNGVTHNKIESGLGFEHEYWDDPLIVHLKEQLGLFNFGSQNSQNNNVNVANDSSNQ